MSPNLRDNLIASVLTTLFFLLLLGVLLSTAIAHSFYPVDCCSGFDCAPINEKRVSAAVGGYMIDRIHFVPQSEVRKSPDGEYHACFPKPDKLRCFWAPPQGS